MDEKEVSKTFPPFLSGRVGCGRYYMAASDRGIESQGTEFQRSVRGRKISVALSIFVEVRDGEQ